MLKKVKDLKNELEILGHAYESMTVTEKVNYINACCNCRTLQIVQNMYRDMCTMKNL